MGKNSPNNILAMIDVQLPDTKTPKNPLRKNREHTLHRRPECTTPADGANHIPDREFTALLLGTTRMRYRTVTQQLVAIGKLHQNSSHANRKNKKQKVTGKGKVTCNKLLSYW